MKLYKPNPEYIRGIVESIVSDYRENVENKDINEIEIIESGEFDFKVKLWFDVSEEKRDFDLFIVRPDNSIQSIREITEKSLNSISPFVQSVNV